MINFLLTGVKQQAAVTQLVTRQVFISLRDPDERGYCLKGNQWAANGEASLTEKSTQEGQRGPG